MMKHLLILLLVLNLSWAEENVEVSIDLEEDTVYVDENGNPVRYETC